MLHYLITLYLIKMLGDATFYDSYDANLPLNTEIVATESREAYERVKLYIDTTPDERLPVLLTLPKDFEEPVPCIVFLHGIGQRKEFIDEITTPFNEVGFAMATFDQLMQGERRLPRDAAPLKMAQSFRRRAGITVTDTRRLIDYLETRDDIDTDRLYLVGASYGAITGSTATAMDERLNAAVLIYGGGNLRKLLSAPLIREGAGAFAPVLDRVLIPMMEFFMGVSDPVQYVAGISPRPTLFQAGSYDQLVDPRASAALYDAALEPKEISWYESDHIGLDLEIVMLVLEEAKNWLLERDREALQEAA